MRIRNPGRFSLLLGAATVFGVVAAIRSGLKFKQNGVALYGVASELAHCLLIFIILDAIELLTFTPLSSARQRRAVAKTIQLAEVL